MNYYLKVFTYCTMFCISCFNFRISFSTEERIEIKRSKLTTLQESLKKLRHRIINKCSNSAKTVGYSLILSSLLGIYFIKKIRQVENTYAYFVTDLGYAREWLYTLLISPIIGILVPCRMLVDIFEKKLEIDIQFINNLN